MLPGMTLEEKEKAKVLFADGETYSSIARTLKRSPHTVKAYLVKPDVKDEVEAVKQNLADFYENMAHRMLSSITDEDIKKINAYQRVVSSGISTDKMRLLRGEATQNVRIEELSLEVHTTLGNLQALKTVLGKSEE